MFRQMRGFYLSLNRWVIKAGVCACQLVISSICFAQVEPQLGGSNFGDTATKIQTEASSAVAAGWTLAQAIGIVIAISGGVLWYRISKDMSQKTHGQALITIIIGAGIYFLPYLMGTAGSSFLSPS